MYESAFEQNVCKFIKSLGGKAYKWVSPGTAGVPDRICVLPRGMVIFIETKRPGVSDGLRVRQKKEIDRLKGLGCLVWRISDMDELKENLRSLSYEI